MKPARYARHRLPFAVDTPSANGRPQDVVGFLSEIHAKHVDLYLHQQGIDTTTPAGKALFQMCGGFAEFERAMIVERVRSGLARARAQSTKSGRAIAAPR